MLVCHLIKNGSKLKFNELSSHTQKLHRQVRNSFLHVVLSPNIKIIDCVLPKEWCKSIWPFEKKKKKKNWSIWIYNLNFQLTHGLFTQQILYFKLIQLVECTCRV